MPSICWTRYFLKEQGYSVNENVVFQDNQSAILWRRRVSVADRAAPTATPTPQVASQGGKIPKVDRDHTRTNQKRSSVEPDESRRLRQDHRRQETKSEGLVEDQPKPSHRTHEGKSS